MTKGGPKRSAISLWGITLAEPAPTGHVLSAVELRNALTELRNALTMRGGGYCQGDARGAGSVPFLEAGYFSWSHRESTLRRMAWTLPAVMAPMMMNPTRMATHTGEVLTPKARIMSM